MAGEADEHVKKRRRVAAGDRKRVNTACLACRRLKEKCDGDGRSPCTRCSKHGRTCERQQSDGQNGHTSPSDERTSMLEAVVHHFLPNAELDISSLRDIVRDLTRDSKGTESDPTDCHPADSRVLGTLTGGQVGSPEDVSAKRFTADLTQYLSLRLGNSEIPWSSSKGRQTADNERLLESNFHFDRGAIPPRDVAMFLMSTYFSHAQTITPFAEQTWATSKLQILYDGQPDLRFDDAPWLCCVLVIMAIGAQFSDLDNDGTKDRFEDTGSIPRSNESASTNLYRHAVDLLPTVVHIADTNSAQALGLLGHFALARDEHLAVRYFEMSANMVKHRVSYQELQGPDEIVGLPAENQADRIFDVSSAWRRHLCLLGAESPITEGKRFNFAHLTSMEWATPWSIMRGLVDWREAIVYQLRIYLKNGRPNNLEQVRPLLELRARYKRWFEHVPFSDTPFLQLNRWQSRLHLYHNLNILTLGRPFILSSMRAAEDTDHVANPRIATSPLVKSTEFAAYNIIDICSMLQQSSLLSRFSHIESTACYAAVVVMLAQCLGRRCRVFRNKLDSGMDMLRILIPQDELSRLEALECSIQQIVTSSCEEQVQPHANDSGDSGSTIAQLKSWVATLENGSRSSLSVCGASNSDTIPFDELNWSTFDEALDIDLTFLKSPWRLENAAVA